MRAKQLVTVILLISLAGQCLNRAVIVTSYYANSSAFAKKCVNKAKPQMHCNGRCQMMKKLQQEENNDKRDHERRSFQDETLSSRSFFAFIDHHPGCINTEYPDNYRDFFTTGAVHSIFHPPGIIA